MPDGISADTEIIKTQERGKTGIKKPKMITNEDAGRISAILPKTDKLIFALAIESGLRISDILDIKANQIGKIMYVRERKTGKHRVVELSEGLYEQLRPYAKPEDVHNYFLFHSPRSPRAALHRSTFHRHLKRAGKIASVNVSAHSARKLYAQNAFKSTGSIFEVQKALNHKYVTTTAAYLDIDINELIARAAAQKT